MQVDADRLEFAPPPQPDLWRAFALAIIAHLLLLLALTWGIHWKREAENVTAEAELWSAVPQQAAPAPVQPLPPVVQAPVVQAPPLPVPTPEVKAPPPPPVARKEPDIALEREKQKREQAERRQEEMERQKKLDARKKQEELKREQLAEKKAAEERKKKEELAKTAKTKKQQLEEEKKLAALRQENLARMMKGLPGGTGAPTSTGTAARSSGPSPGYASRIAARIKPNIVFTESISGNPAAEVEIRVAPDGTIVGSKLVESSGNKAWDEAVLRAIDRTGSLPRDTDGTVVPRFPIRFRPRD